MSMGDVEVTGATSESAYMFFFLIWCDIEAGTMHDLSIRSAGMSGISATSAAMEASP